ncbi:MAG: FtsX-like permease family protein [Candidatus Dormiibacterota bacterium]
MYFRYLGRELRRRARSASVVAIGLALAVGLVITVTAAAAGVKSAQGQVLHSLYGVGTNMTVTKPATPGSGGPFRFGGAPPSRSQSGQAFSRDRLSSTGGLTTLDASQVSAISKIAGVAGATGTLSLTSIHVTGTFGGGPSGTGSGSSSSSPFSVTTFSVDGVNADDPGLGPLSSGNVTAGSQAVSTWFTRVQSNASSSDQLLALVDSSYAKQNSLKVGSKVTVSGTAFKVLGVVSFSQSATPVDMYIPLSEAQKLAGDSGKVNTIYVQADTASDVSSVQSKIQHLMPKATVTTAQDLANQVTGSLSTAASLADSLGVWLAALVLVAAFVLAALLTTVSVTRRVREFGTLKAMGWRSRRIVGQVLGESVVQGVVGGALGIGLGVLGAFLVTKLAPPLKAIAGTTTPTSFPGVGSGRSGFGGRGPGSGSGASARRSFLHTFAPSSHSVTIHLTAPLNLDILALAVGLAIAGGLIAGIVGGWRAARLQPAEALRRVE